MQKWIWFRARLFGDWLLFFLSVLFFALRLRVSQTQPFSSWLCCPSLMRGPDSDSSSFAFSHYMLFFWIFVMRTSCSRLHSRLFCSSCCVASNQKIHSYSCNGDDIFQIKTKTRSRATKELKEEREDKEQWSNCTRGRLGVWNNGQMVKKKMQQTKTQRTRKVRWGRGK